MQSDDENTPGKKLDIADSSQGSDLQKIDKAVALKWEQSGGEVPKVAAAGQGHVAAQIMELAFEHGVKVREDADLVELLYALDIDSPIPLEAYMAVAEILSYVYRANDAARHGRPLDSARVDSARESAGGSAP